MKTASEIRDEIERLERQLNSTRREFKVTITCFIDACNEDEIELDVRNMLLGKGTGNLVSFSCSWKETGS